MQKESFIYNFDLGLKNYQKTALNIKKHKKIAYPFFE